MFCHIYQSRWSQEHVAISRLCSWNRLPLWEWWAEHISRIRRSWRDLDCPESGSGQPVVTSSRRPPPTICFLLVYVSDFQPFSSHGTCKLITKILLHTQKNFFCWSGKRNRYDFDSFTPDGYCYVGCCLIFIWQSKGEEVSAPD